MQNNDMTLKKQWFITSRKGKICDYYDFDPSKVNIKKIKYKQLGSGSYGIVIKGKVKGGKSLRAIKMIKKHQIKDPKKFQQEISIMRELDHPNIIKLFEFFEDDRYVYLVMELCEGGELFDKIVAKGKFTESMARYYFKQLMSALNYIHSKNICHRDLKPENFLLLDDSDDSPLKVIDFGLSMHFNNDTVKKAGGNDKIIMKTKAGTPYYISPEVLKGNYDISCDIWSAGVILYIFLSGVPPFYGANDYDIIERVKAEKYTFDIYEFQKVSESAKGLIKRMITKPSLRLTADQVLKHNWMISDDIAFSNPLDINWDQLQSFIKSSRLKKTVLTLIASQLNEMEIKKLGRNFAQLDINNDGVIQMEEIKNEILKLNKQSSNEIVELFKGLDSNHSGKIDYSEFLAASIEKNIYLNQDKLWLAFKQLDIDGNGKITAQELKSVLGKENSQQGIQIVSMNYWEQLIDDADINKDGEIDYKEFIQMMETSHN